MTIASEVPDYLDELESLAAGFDLLPAGFLLCGREFPDPIPAHAAAGRAPALSSLTAILYNEVYSRALEPETPELAAPVTVGGEPSFVDALSRGNLTEELVDPGWLAQSIPSPGIAVVTRNGVTKALAPGQYLAEGELRVGQQVTRLVAKESRQAQAGFYYVCSEVEFDYTPTVMRFYWNIRSSGASRLVTAVTRHLNRYRIPFLFKCLASPLAYTRRDAAVLFVKRQYLQVCREVLPLLVAEVAGWLREEVPFLTLRLAPGVGFAENPEGLQSFGVHRMQLVARGLLGAREAGVHTARERVQELVRAFAQQGIDPEFPFLNSGSDPAYARSLILGDFAASVASRPP